jgi:SAM-dependent methyltransferase
MLDRSFEYYKMSQVESDHWWYRNLHETVFNHIQSDNKNRSVKILDCGCGTGGCISYLKKQGYEQFYGFDLSTDAVKIFKEIHPELAGNITILDIREMANHYEPDSFDVIVCNDVLCYFSTDEIKSIISGFYKLLRDDGLVILNLPALDAFSGIHDKAVGIKQRFQKSGFDSLISQTKFRIKHITYRLFLLSPLIYLARLAQRIKLKLDKNVKIESDISLPPKMVNELLFKLCHFENKWLRTTPFGSSLFVVLRKIR